MEATTANENAFLRSQGYRIEQRQSGQEPVWKSRDGTLHTHKDALRFALEGFGYVPGKRPGEWHHVHTDVTMAQDVVVRMILGKLRDYSKARG